MYQTLHEIKSTYSGLGTGNIEQPLVVSPIQTPSC